ncbi:DEAD/DEAH box helicase [Spiractinospora alimapuensis]|uniref:DEAD/DEAH box helicase n=1 Tax=Spiractinospora alimapuensis TaxID=2820884 RepID=UPI001F31A4E7|nr:DEAD/DEAH box helicase [Spiractinospora alimapuensis]QVQ52735.1 DEAD/DEAH box helicase [Spiractinospora alimapuensis]
MSLATAEARNGFDALPLRPELLDAVAELGYDEPTPIQRAAIPPLVDGHDLLGQAATGTGKTAAFALPVLERVRTDQTDRAPIALILVPTRELAVQVSQAVDDYGKSLGVRVLPVYGGTPIGRQLRSLERGVDVVVATPGRALDHLRRGSLHLNSLQITVLDEADEMLDMGFTEDIEAILEETPDGVQTVLFSATMPARIEDIANRHLTNPQRIMIEPEKRDPGEAPRVRQTAYVVPRGYKPAVLGRLLDVEAPAAAIVFCRTREEVDRLTEVATARGHRAEQLHGGMSQEQRDRVMDRLRSGAARLLVATDVAARGLDIDHLTHVINYSVPRAPESYVHRIGRVGRAGREGVAISLMEPREHRLLKTVRHVTGFAIPVEQVPSVSELQALRAARLRDALAQRMSSTVDTPEDLREVARALGEEHDLVDVAATALRMAQEAATGGAPDEEIPEASLKPPKDTRGRRGERGERGERGGGPRGERRSSGAPAAGQTRLFIGVGRSSRIRPQDLVGAIAGEAGLNGRDIGAIDIADRFSLVEVPSGAADHVISSLQGTTIKGRKPTVRRDSRASGGGGRRERR